MPTDPKSFVVQLEHGAGRGRLVGRVESLDSGEIRRFASSRGLLHFLRRALLAPGSDEAKGLHAIDPDEDERDEP